MPLLPTDDPILNNPPSNLIDLIGQVRDAFKFFGDATPVLIGKQYLKPGAGSAPRVVFVPELSGKIGAPREMGNAASVTHSCTFYVRAKESGDDLTRFRQAYRLADFVIDAIGTAGTGRIEWGAFSDGSPTDTDAYGAEFVGSFTYRRDVLHFQKRWPIGTAGILDDLNATVTPKNGS